MSNLLTIHAIIEEFEECMLGEHGYHKELDNYYFDDGAIGARCALQLNENEWSKRLVNCLNSCSYEYLQGWRSAFYGRKTDTNDFDEIQQMHNAVNAYVFHDIFISKQQNVH